MPRSAVIIIEDERVAMIQRLRGGHTYYLFPGGGVEPGETIEEAAIREAYEELGLHIQLGPLVAEVEFCNPELVDRTQYYYLSHSIEGKFGTGEGEELSSSPQSLRGSYRPVWLPLIDLRNHDVRPKELAQALSSDDFIAGKEILRIEEHING